MLLNSLFILIAVVALAGTLVYFVWAYKRSKKYEQELKEVKLELAKKKQKFVEINQQMKKAMEEVYQNLGQVPRVKAPFQPKDQEGKK